MRITKNNLCFLISEYQTIAKLIKDNGLCAVNLVSQNLTRQLVEHEVLNGTLDGTGTEVWIVAFFSQIADGSIGGLKTNALWLQYIRHLLQYGSGTPGASSCATPHA